MAVLVLSLLPFIGWVMLSYTKWSACCCNVLSVVLAVDDIAAPIRMDNSKRQRSLSLPSPSSLNLSLRRRCEIEVNITVNTTATATHSMIRIASGEIVAHLIPKNLTTPSESNKISSSFRNNSSSNSSNVNHSNNNSTTSSAA